MPTNHNPEPFEDPKKEPPILDSNIPFVYIMEETYSGSIFWILPGLWEDYAQLIPGSPFSVSL